MLETTKVNGLSPMIMNPRESEKRTESHQNHIGNLPSRMLVQYPFSLGVM